jgi:very-short-patch-repair endonuclease
VTPPSPADISARDVQDSPPSLSGEGGREAAGWGLRPAADVSTNRARALRKRLTPQEARLWLRLRALRPAGFHFRRQVPIGDFIVDFACLKHRIVVELDGGGHTREVTLRRDRFRDLAIGRLGFHVLRFWNAEVQTNIHDVVETILSNSRQTPPASLRSAPSPEREGG